VVFAAGVGSNAFLYRRTGCLALAIAATQAKGLRRDNKSRAFQSVMAAADRVKYFKSTSVSWAVATPLMVGAGAASSGEAVNPGLESALSEAKKSLIQHRRYYGALAGEALNFVKWMRAHYGPHCPRPSVDVEAKPWCDFRTVLETDDYLGKDFGASWVTFFLAWDDPFSLDDLRESEVFGKTRSKRVTNQMWYLGQSFDYVTDFKPPQLTALGNNAPSEWGPTPPQVPGSTPGW
jgi:hypothetical protein